MAAIACAHHVFRLDRKFTAELKRSILQFNEISTSNFVGGKTYDASKFSIVGYIAESLKTNKA
jgi:hypothetical protein